jgi:glycosyltransferase involved in cell wall biosynthesis
LEPLLSREDAAALRPGVRIVIPAFNEGQRIGPTITTFCERFGSNATVVVVADGCNDHTSSVVRRAQRRFPNLQLIELTSRLGKGGAIRVGFSTGEEEFVGFVDSDGATSAAEFERLYGIARRHQVQAVIGSRWLEGARVEPRQPLFRRFASRTFNKIVRGLFPLDFHDTQCGAKIFRREALQSALEHLELCDFASDIEMLLQLVRAGHEVLEVPTVWADVRNGTKVELLSVSWNMLRSVLYLRLRESRLGNKTLLQALRGSLAKSAVLSAGALPETTG